MAKKEGKKEGKLSVKPKKKEKMEITESRPYDIWTDLDQMFNRFRTDMDDLFWSPLRRFPVAMSEFRTPSTDIADHGDKYEVCAEMPGIPKDDINIEVTPNSIEISAEHQESEEEEKKNWLRRERSSMSYYRNFELPEEIKSDNVDAQFKDGILTVMLPKVKPKPKHKSKKVNIK
jgi:HSP20 family protein